ncbi:hypothetical protein LB504_006121 [Fusarium proliferatum]|nr:hypothetical protein LB504_006121 [Fusarium proliferatum]
MSEPTSITGPTHTHTIWRKREKKLSMTQKLVSRVTTSPEEKLNKFIMKHKIYWSNQWDNKLRLTYWEYVTQVHTDDPRKVDPRVDKIK